MSDVLYKLTNSEFDFEFAGESYRIRRANLDKAVQYQQKLKELQDNKELGAELKIVAFCIYIVLKDKDPNITLEWIMDSTPADIDALECLTTLGFINPKRLETARKIEEAATKKLTSDPSSSI